MRKLVPTLVMLLTVLFFVTSCEEEDSLPQTTTLNASDGTYIGVIHLSYNAVDGAENYEIDRLNEQTSEWQNIAYTTLTSCDDYGYLLNEGKPTPGQQYQFRFRPYASGPGYGSYSEIETGYAYDPQSIDFTEITRDYGSSTNEISWTDPNDYESLQNVESVEYYVYYADENYPENFSSVGNTTDLSIDHYISSYNVDKVFIYKVITKITYLIHDMSGSNYTNFIEVESNTASEGTGGDGPGIISYTKTDLGTIVSSGDAISFTEIKQNGSNIYLGALKDVSVTGYGKPAAYLFNGSSWSETGGTLPADITNSTTTSKMRIAAGSSKIYLAALSLDSIYVVESTGSSWSANLARKNLGYSECPSAMDIEVLNDELYLAAKVYPDWNLKVLKWDGATWTTIGGDASGFITSGVDVFDVSLENYGGTLYLSYRVENSDYNSTFHIKHLNGTSWDNDLEWTADNIMELKIAKGSSDLYFIANTQTPASYAGGVYKVTSTTSVEELISENDSWFLTPFDITVDSDGNVIITSMKYESESSFYPNINIYDGSEWNTFSGDFSNGMKPVSVHADATTIYFSYGDATNVTSFGDTKTIKAIKLEKTL